MAQVFSTVKLWLVCVLKSIAHHFPTHQPTKFDSHISQVKRERTKKCHKVSSQRHHIENSTSTVLTDKVKTSK